MAFLTIGRLENLRNAQQPQQQPQQQFQQQPQQQVTPEMLYQKLMQMQQPQFDPRMMDLLYKNAGSLSNRLAMPDFATSSVEDVDLRSLSDQIQRSTQNIPDRATLDTGAAWNEVAPMAGKMMRANKIYSSIPLARNPNAELGMKLLEMRGNLGVEGARDERDTATKQAVLKSTTLNDLFKTKADVAGQRMQARSAETTGQASLINALSGLATSASAAQNVQQRGALDVAQFLSGLPGEQAKTGNIRGETEKTAALLPGAVVQQDAQTEGIRTQTDYLEGKGQREWQELDLNRIATNTAANLSNQQALSLVHGRQMAEQGLGFEREKFAVQTDLAKQELIIKSHQVEIEDALAEAQRGLISAQVAKMRVDSSAVIHGMSIEDQRIELAQQLQNMQIDHDGRRLSIEETDSLARSLMNEVQMERFRSEIDLAYRRAEMEGRQLSIEEKKAISENAFRDAQRGLIPTQREALLEQIETSRTARDVALQEVALKIATAKDDSLLKVAERNLIKGKLDVLAGADAPALKVIMAEMIQMQSTLEPEKFQEYMQWQMAANPNVGELLFRKQLFETMRKNQVEVEKKEKEDARQRARSRKR